MRQEPIPSPSEPMQYRAIGLVQGKYIPSEDQLTLGQLITPDGQAISAFLLGRVLSLVKNHLDLTENHLWVVYPRTQEVKNKKPIKRTEETPPPTPPDLRLQIVGIWEPETLHRPAEEADPDAPDSSSGEDSPAIVLAPEPSIAADDGSENESTESEVKDGYFSVRGEIIFYAAEKNQVIVKVQQLNRKEPDQQRAFKLHLWGTIDRERILHHFWDLQVERQGDRLVIVQAHCVGAMPPRRRSKVTDSRPRRDRPFSGNRPERSGTGNPVSPPRSKPILAKPQKDLSKS